MTGSAPIISRLATSARACMGSHPRADIMTYPFAQRQERFRSLGARKEEGQHQGDQGQRASRGEPGAGHRRSRPRNPHDRLLHAHPRYKVRRSRRRVYRGAQQGSDPKTGSTPTRTLGLSGQSLFQAKCGLNSCFHRRRSPDEAILRTPSAYLLKR